MRVPSEDELAAIAAAYVAVTAVSDTTVSDTAAHAPAPSRWRLAGRLPAIDEQRVRFIAAAASRWNAAGRLDG
jgi:hypothetical protein